MLAFVVENIYTDFPLLLFIWKCSLLCFISKWIYGSGTPNFSSLAINQKEWTRAGSKQAIRHESIKNENLWRLRHKKENPLNWFLCKLYQARHQQLTAKRSRLFGFGLIGWMERICNCIWIWICICICICICAKCTRHAISNWQLKVLVCLVSADRLDGAILIDW